MTAGQILAVLALILAVASFVTAAYPLIPVAVILLAITKFVP
jgi:hypothetical protein